MSKAITRFGFCILLLSFLAPVMAQQTIYKWTDEDGVVHFGESPPPGVDAEVITTTPAPTQAPQTTQSTVRSGSTADDAPVRLDTAPTANNPDVAKPVPISEMSLEELDARCEAAREKLIAPIREQTIAECKANQRTDPAACERMHADLGEPQRAPNGTMTPRMFHDIPPCQEAFDERNRRGR